MCLEMRQKCCFPQNSIIQRKVNSGGESQVELRPKLQLRFKGYCGSDENILMH